MNKKQLIVCAKSLNISMAKLNATNPKGVATNKELRNAIAETNRTVRPAVSRKVRLSAKRKK